MAKLNETDGDKLHVNQPTPKVTNRVNINLNSISSKQFNNKNLSIIRPNHYDKSEMKFKDQSDSKQSKILFEQMTPEKFSFPESPRARKFKEINDFLKNQEQNLKINT